MHIRDIFRRDRVTFSFEFFPPRTEEGAALLRSRMNEFRELAPSFVSVTYGAGGSTRDRTHGLVEQFQKNFSFAPVPHLTCVGHYKKEINQILDKYASLGVGNILALRGDKRDDGEDGDFQFAVDLVRLIHRHNEKGNHSDIRGFGVGVAGFPEGHPETPNRLQHFEHLREKVDAGVDWITTQMFFDNHAFWDWCNQCEIYKINTPKIAGLMPIESIRGMRRMAELSGGTNFPAKLQRRIYRHQDDPESIRQIGIQWCIEQCNNLLDNGVQGIHFYTLNRSDATATIYKSLGRIVTMQEH